MPTYSEKVMDHFNNPRNMGEIENPDGVGKVGNPVCGDVMNLYIKVENDRLDPLLLAPVEHIRLVESDRT